MPHTSKPIQFNQQGIIESQQPSQDELRKIAITGTKAQRKARRKHEPEEESTDRENVSDVVSGFTRTAPVPQFQHQDEENKSRDVNISLTPSVPSGVDASKLPDHGHSGGPSKGTTTQNVYYGSSPPDESRYHDGGTVSSADPQTALNEMHRGFSQNSPKTSPSMAYRRPVRPINGYQSFRTYLESPPENSGLGNSPVNDPRYHPPPHLPQAHFFKAPEIDFGTPQPKDPRTLLKHRPYSTFDRLYTEIKSTGYVFKDVLTRGHYGKLDIFHVTGRHLTHMYTLNKLRGRVLEAKILPWLDSQNESQDAGPMMVIVLHGACANLASSVNERPGSGHSDNGPYDASASTVHTLNNIDLPADGSTEYQTTVEVYSLRTMTCIATLLKGPRLRPDPTRDADSGEAASANLRIQASGGYIAVGSGASGEVFLFEIRSPMSQHTKLPFRCIGKVWTRTSAKRNRSSSVSSSASEAEPVIEANISFKASANVALFSLSHRWLAIVPPSSSSGTTLHFQTELLDPNQRAPGLSSHASPSEPHVTCNLDTPDAESTLNKVARDLTQEVFRGAHWLGAQSLQAWNTYWAKSSDRNLGVARELNQTSTPTVSQPDLPPTHANSHSPMPNNETCSVALLDLPRLATAQQIRSDRALQPIATFSPPYGCSFVSFAPNGLHILVTSKKGDVHQIWDLTGMIHGKTIPGSDDASPSVRELVRFTRMTVARVVEVAWTEPKGERVAIVTEKGTAHIYDVPASAFQWPPPRRKARPASTRSANTTGESEDGRCSPPPVEENTFAARVTAVTSKTQPFFSAVRRQPMSVSNTFTSFSNLGFPATAGIKGGKVMAAGLRQSVGAAAGTVSTFRHLGENRITLPGLDLGIFPQCVRWLQGKSVSLAAQGGGVVKVYKVHQSGGEKPAKRRPSVLGTRPLEMTVPETAGSTKRRAFSPTQPARRRSQTGGPVGEASSLPGATSRDGGSHSHPLSYAEIESNAPYQPFHTDPRVSFHVFNDEASTKSLAPGSPWTFGDGIPSTRVHVGPSTKSRTDPAGDEIPTAMETSINYEGTVEEGQHIVVSTRRRRLRDDEADAGGVERDFFDDDCAVVDFADSRV